MARAATGQGRAVLRQCPPARLESSPANGQPLHSTAIMRGPPARAAPSTSAAHGHEPVRHSSSDTAHPSVYRARCRCAPPRRVREWTPPLHHAAARTMKRPLLPPRIKAPCHTTCTMHKAGHAVLPRMVALHRRQQAGVRHAPAAPNSRSAAPPNADSERMPPMLPCKGSNVSGSPREGCAKRMPAGRGGARRGSVHSNGGLRRHAQSAAHAAAAAAAAARVGHSTRRADATGSRKSRPARPTERSPQALLRGCRSWRPVRLLTFCASSPFSRVFCSWSRMMMNGRP
jgi:hypothetical protein